MEKNQLIDLAKEAAQTAREGDDMWCRKDLDELAQAVLAYFS